jgi:type I restriction enzyme, S subunit
MFSRVSVAQLSQTRTPESSRRQRFSFPLRAFQRIFREGVEPLFDQREVLELNNQRLRAARDLLLPRLMSSEISV